MRHFVLKELNLIASFVNNLYKGLACDRHTSLMRCVDHAAHASGPTICAQAHHDDPLIFILQMICNLNENGVVVCWVW